MIEQLAINERITMDKKTMTDLEIALFNLTDIFEHEAHKLSANGQHIFKEAIEQLAIFTQSGPPTGKPSV